MAARRRRPAAAAPVGLRRRRRRGDRADEQHADAQRRRTSHVRVALVLDRLALLPWLSDITLTSTRQSTATRSLHDHRGRTRRCAHDGKDQWPHRPSALSVAAVLVVAARVVRARLAAAVEGDELDTQIPRRRRSSRRDEPARGAEQGRTRAAPRGGSRRAIPDDPRISQILRQLSAAASLSRASSSTRSRPRPVRPTGAEALPISLTCQGTLLRVPEASCGSSAELGDIQSGKVIRQGPALLGRRHSVHAAPARLHRRSATDEPRSSGDGRAERVRLRADRRRRSSDRRRTTTASALHPDGVDDRHPGAGAQKAFAARQAAKERRQKILIVAMLAILVDRPGIRGAEVLEPRRVEQLVERCPGDRPGRSADAVERPRHLVRRRCELRRALKRRPARPLRQDHASPGRPHARQRPEPPGLHDPFAPARLARGIAAPAAPQPVAASPLSEHDRHRQARRRPVAVSTAGSSSWRRSRPARGRARRRIRRAGAQAAASARSRCSTRRTGGRCAAATGSSTPGRSRPATT